MAQHTITPDERAEVNRILARHRKKELTRFIHSAIKDGRIGFDTSKAKIEMLFGDYLDDKEQMKLETEERRRRNAEMAEVVLSETERRLAREVERKLNGEVALSEAERLMAEEADPKLRYRGITREYNAVADAEAKRILMEHGTSSRNES